MLLTVINLIIQRKKISDRNKVFLIIRFCVLAESSEKLEFRKIAMSCSLQNIPSPTLSPWHIEEALGTRLSLLQRTSRVIVKPVFH